MTKKKKEYVIEDVYGFRVPKWLFDKDMRYFWIEKFGRDAALRLKLIKIKKFRELVDK